VVGCLVYLEVSVAVCAFSCSFAQLATLLDGGQPTRTDKNVIISDAVRVLTQLRAECNQLRQLNKFLEVRAAGAK
jgi:hypothetical protein